MTCPFCKAPLTVREYAFTHLHPTPEGRRLGAALMVLGAAFVVLAFLR